MGPGNSVLLKSRAKRAGSGEVSEAKPCPEILQIKSTSSRSVFAAWGRLQSAWGFSPASADKEPPRNAGRPPHLAYWDSTGHFTTRSTLRYAA